MIILITGASHAGKTLLAQKLLEKYSCPYLSIDHLKMGLIRSGNTDLTPEDDDELTEYLWPIIREIVKTAIENRQNLIVEGCYIPFHWRRDFDERYLPSIRFICLAMSERYIENHFSEIIGYESEIEDRLVDEDCTIESLKAGNRDIINGFQHAGEQVVLIDSDYEQTIKGLLDRQSVFGGTSVLKISRIMEKMISFSDGNIHDIDHFVRVWNYAKTIAELEDIDSETQYILEVAAITHDIACPLCREKYGNTNGKHQEEEGIPLVKSFLSDSGMTKAQIDRVAFLVGHHHNFKGIDGLDWQILIEADYIANATENGYTKENVKEFIQKIMKTESGKRLAHAVFCL